MSLNATAVSKMTVEELRSLLKDTLDLEAAGFDADNAGKDALVDMAKTNLDVINEVLAGASEDEQDSEEGAEPERSPFDLRTR